MQGTKTYRLLYTSVENGINAYLDALLGTSKDGFYISGFVIKVFGDVIHWKTKKQELAVVLSTEVEYVALSFVFCEVTGNKRNV